MRIAEHELKQELFAWEDKSLWVGPTNRNQQLVVMRLVMVVKLLREFAPEGSRCMVRRKHESNFESKPREKGTEGECRVEGGGKKAVSARRACRSERHLSGERLPLRDAMKFLIEAKGTQL